MPIARQVCCGYVCIASSRANASRLNIHRNTPQRCHVTEVRGKGHPRTGYEGPEGEQRYSSTLSLKSALDAVGWSTPRLGRFTPGKDLVPIV